MNQTYYFGIHGESVGPLDEPTIRSRIQEGAITKQTLAWCRSMDNWRPIEEIPELIETLGTLLAAAEGPPPLPTAAVSSTTPPPLPNNGAKAAGPAMEDPMDPNYRVPPGLSSCGAAAYHLVFWLYRPWRKKPSRVREFVRQDPSRAVPVAALSLVALFLTFCVAVYPISENLENPSPAGGQSQMPPGMVAGGGGIPYQALKDAQGYKQNVIDEVHHNNRESFNRRYKTYQDATYDWRHKD